MKKAKKAKTGAKAKAKKLPISGPAMRDLELMDPAAKQVKGGLRKRE
jgi:hypothetical protein